MHAAKNGSEGHVAWCSMIIYCIRENYIVTERFAIIKMIGTEEWKGLSCESRVQSMKRKLVYRVIYKLIRESVDSLCRDGTDMQYMQYLSKSRITSPQTH